MQPHSEEPDPLDEMRDRIIGLGELSVHKSYYPLLQQRLGELGRFRALIDETDDMIMMVRMQDQRCVDANHACSVLLGYTTEEILSHGIATFVSPESQADFSTLLSHAKESGRQEKSEIVMITSQGEKFPADLSIRFAIFNRLEYGVIVAHDIRERKKYENALNTAQKKLNIINYLTHNDIKSQVFIVRAYLDILRQIARHPEETAILEKLTSTTVEIQGHIDFAENYYEMGAQDPKWQNFNDVLLFALSHLSPIDIIRKPSVKKIEILADLLLEKGLTHLLDYIYRQGKMTDPIRLLFNESPEGLTIIFEKEAVGIPPEEKTRIFAYQKSKNNPQSLFLIREILGITSIALQETGDYHTVRFEIFVSRDGYKPV